MAMYNTQCTMDNGGIARLAAHTQPCLPQWGGEAVRTPDSCLPPRGKVSPQGTDEGVNPCAILAPLVSF